MKISYILSICLISLLVLIPQRVVRSCSFSPDADSYGYNFFNQEVLGNPGLFPFLFTWHYYYGNYETKAPDPVIDEWMPYFKNIPLKEDVSKLIYTVPLGQLLECVNLIAKKKEQMPESLSNNSCLRYVFTTKDIEFLTYLLYARRCQPNVVWEDYWSSPDFKIDSLGNLGKEGARLYKKATNDLIRLKYAFQLVRLSHYAGKNDECISLYDQLIESMPLKSYTRFRALCHKAGAYYNKELFVLASYHYSVVFKNCHPLRTTAWKGFRIKETREFEELIKYCKDKSEQATVYAMRSVQPYAKSLGDMKKIFKLDPSSEYNDLLLVREVKMFENQYLGKEIKNDENSDYQYDDDFNRFFDTTYLSEFRKFVGSAINESKIKKPALWKLAAGFLAVYAGDFAEAQRYVSELKHMEISDEVMKKSIANLQIGLDITKLNTLDENEIERIYKEFQDSKISLNDHPDVYYSYPDNQFRYFLDKLHFIYTNSNDKLKAFLCNSDFETLLWSPDIDMVTNLLEFMNKKGKKPFETFLSMKGGSRNELLEMKGTLLMASGKQEEAVKVFKSIPSDFLKGYMRFYINADPFAGNFRDCLACDDSIMEKIEYVKTHCITKLLFAEKIIKLKKTAKGNGEHAAEANFLLGNAFYNTTYFGTAWMAFAYRRYYSEINLASDCSVASAYYQKTMQLTKNKELAAKCCYMAAKCEHNNYYNREKASSWDLVNMPNSYFYYQSFFHLLKEKYADTEYYKDVIKECSYFREYLALVK